jgi:hypothetical protein
VNQREAGIGVDDARLEHAGDGELLQARNHARGGHDALRRDQRDLVAAQHPERAREIGAEHHAELAGTQRVERARAHVAGEIRHFLLLLGKDAAHHRAAHRLAIGEHRLRLDEGRRAEHARMLRHRLRQVLPVLEAVVVREDLQVRHHAEDARAHLLLEPVHHRQHHDQRPDADRDADHGDRGIDADEAIAPPGAGIAQADQQLVSHLVGSNLGARILQSPKWTRRLRFF